MSLYIKGQEVEAMFKYDGGLIDAKKEEYYVPVWAARLHKNGYLYYKEYEGRPSELFYKLKTMDIHIPVNTYVFKCRQSDNLVVLTEDEICDQDNVSIAYDNYYRNEVKKAEAEIDSLKKANKDLENRLRKYEWNREIMKRMIEGVIK